MIIISEMLYIILLSLKVVTNEKIWGSRVNLTDRFWLVLYSAGNFLPFYRAAILGCSIKHFALTKAKLLVLYMREIIVGAANCKQRRLVLYLMQKGKNLRPSNTAKKKCRKLEANIPRKRMSGPQSQFKHSCVCGLIIYSHDGAAVSAGGNMWTDPGNI
jgi:hypothetical protein